MCRSGHNLHFFMAFFPLYCITNELMIFGSLCSKSLFPLNVRGSSPEQVKVEQRDANDTHDLEIFPSFVYLPSGRRVHSKSKERQERLGSVRSKSREREVRWFFPKSKVMRKRRLMLGVFISFNWPATQRKWHAWLNNLSSLLIFF